MKLGILLVIAAKLFKARAVDNNGSFLRGRQVSEESHRALIDSSTAIPEGQAVVCYSDEEKVYRWSEGELHWYPNYLVASSWDENWRSYMEVDCLALNLPIGTRMRQQITLPYEGSIMCFDDDSMIFHWSSSTRLLRRYPNPQIAKLWHDYWYRDFFLVDCNGLGLEYGPELTAGVPDDGSILTCRRDEEKVYLVDGGVLHWFPNPKIASSWKFYWRPVMTHVDCDFLTFGEDMPMKLITGIPEDGSIATCIGKEEKVYMMDGGVLRWLPNPEVASSWKVYWRSEMMHIDCEVFRIGEDMPMKQL